MKSWKQQDLKRRKDGRSGNTLAESTQLLSVVSFDMLSVCSDSLGAHTLCVVVSTSPVFYSITHVIFCFGGPDSGSKEKLWYFLTKKLREKEKTSREGF